MEALSARVLTHGRAWALALAAALAAGGCGKKGAGGATAAPAGQAPAGAAPIHVEGTPHTDAVVNALRGAGLKAEGFTVQVPVPYGASFCELGQVENIDTMVCEFRDSDSLTRGKTALMESWGKEGSQTGLAFASKLTLIGVFDRARQDPNGKLISRVVETFRKL